tara:strand:- start:234 stop:800 length:567 start_codon:yes stop_codon:yes gene_type:complete
MTQFQEKGFEIIKGYALPYFSSYLRNYFTLIAQNNPFLYGGDEQAPNSHCAYGDPAFDMAMAMSTDDIGKIVGKTLIPQYTYARIYNKGSVLKIHSDRPECQYSVTLSLGGQYDQLWPIWIKDYDGKSHEVPLEEGDMLVYSGCELEHWREEFKGETQYQLFMHYVDAEGEFKDRVFDGRPNLGMKKQ